MSGNSLDIVLDVFPVVALEKEDSMLELAAE